MPHRPSQTVLQRQGGLLTADSELIIGVDPGTRVTGYGIIAPAPRGWQAVDFGCIRPPQKMETSDRYLVIYESIGTLLDRHRPSALSVETQYVHKNVQSALKLGMARGAIIIAARQRDIPVFEYTPSRAKKAVCGNGRASKEQVQAMTQRLLHLSSLPQPEDAADALALALCHANAFRFQ